MVVLVIPYIVWQQSFDLERLQGIFSKFELLPDSPVIPNVQWVAIGLVLVFTVFWWLRFYQKKPQAVSNTSKEIYALFLGHWGLYVLFSLLVTGAFMSSYRIEQYLYILNWVVVAVLIQKTQPDFSPQPLAPKQWGVNFGVLLGIVAVLTLILINSHGELKNAHKRFGAPPPVEEAK